MKSTFNNFESVADYVIFEDQQSGVATQTLEFPGGEDEDGGDDEEDDTDKTKVSDDDNPPLDEEVVHSPLPTQGGGKPGGKTTA